MSSSAIIQQPNNHYSFEVYLRLSKTPLPSSFPSGTRCSKLLVSSNASCHEMSARDGILRMTCLTSPPNTVLPSISWLLTAIWISASSNWLKKNGVWHLSFVRSYRWVFSFVFLCYRTNLPLNVRFLSMAHYFFHAMHPTSAPLSQLWTTSMITWKKPVGTSSFRRPSVPLLL